MFTQLCCAGAVAQHYANQYLRQFIATFSMKRVCSAPTLLSLFSLSCWLMLSLGWKSERFPPIAGLLRRFSRAVLQFTALDLPLEWMPGQAPMPLYETLTRNQPHPLLSRYLRRTKRYQS
ncbi:hypothetical protein M011DRAFT_18299 [Sporormia fimetaria CBS 119925]|uniref:Uncharacterized protein n=1 Tax=Sporormia fimetaria CBS 119925 TaxID=1340428 RepID=A0A6A6VPS2_9PLEO|nr:hypothetical protein M011DRAFT_18299 [Sporormia fimetaria CBS 119925]